jgi:hypothetical protein
MHHRDCLAKRAPALHAEPDLVKAKVRIAVASEDIVLSVPQIALRFIHFGGLLLFLFGGGDAFGFLIARRPVMTRQIGAFATDEQRPAAHDER